MAAQGSHAGRELLGRYQVGELLAQGALCPVYQGEDTVLRRPIIVKVAAADLIEAYRDALHLTAAFTHPAVVVSYDAIAQDERLFLIQEYVQARPLAAYARDGIPSARAVDLASQITRALAYAHAHDIIHGDLSPSAVLVDRQATVRINNFGLPADRTYFTKQAQAVRDSYLSSDGDVIDLDAPTVAREATSLHAHPLTAADDVRAVGLLLWQVLSEQAQRSGPVGAPVRRFRRDVPLALRDLVTRTVLSDHPNPVSSAETLLAELEELAAVLASERTVNAELTPPALRVAREALAREAAWSVEETLGVLRQWPVHAGNDSVSASDPTVADPAPVRLVEQQFSFPTPRIGSPRLNLPSRPLARRPVTTGRPATGGSRGRAALPSPPRSMRPLWLDNTIGPLSVGRLFVYGAVLFVLFFLIGYFGPNLLGIP